MRNLLRMFNFQSLFYNLMFSHDVYGYYTYLFNHEGEVEALSLGRTTNGDPLVASVQ